MTTKPILLLIFCIALLSCKEKKSTGNTANDQPAIKADKTTGLEKNMDAMLDSIKTFKPIKLSINEEHSDVDELVPIGFNNHGSLAFLINENSGGSSGTRLGILPAYQDFSLDALIGRDDDTDTILTKNKELIYFALHSQGISLKNSVRKISLDSLQKVYGLKFDVKKTNGPPSPDDPSGKKTLTSVRITWSQGESAYPSEITSKQFPSTYGIYDVYISDYLVIPGEEGLFGFVVVVTEGAGFEGYVRKSIEVLDIGVVKGRD